MGAITYRGERFSGYNIPKRTPNHPTKSHAVLAKVGNVVKLIRFGQQGVQGSPPRPGESDADRKRRAAFKARHAQSIAQGKLSAAWWADKVKWSRNPSDGNMKIQRGTRAYSIIERALNAALEDGSFDSLFSGLSGERYRWNALFLGLRLTGDNINDVYRDFNDAHIDTAMKNILSSRKVRKNPSHHAPVDTRFRGHIVAGVTYEVVTPESAAEGEVEDAGWHREKFPMRFRDATDLVMEFAPYQHVQSRDGTLIFYGADAEQDYRDGSSTRYDVIVDFYDAVTQDRFERWWNDYNAKRKRRGW